MVKFKSSGRHPKQMKRYLVYKYCFFRGELYLSFSWKMLLKFLLCGSGWQTSHIQGVSRIFHINRFRAPSRIKWKYCQWGHTNKPNNPIIKIWTNNEITSSDSWKLTCYTSKVNESTNWIRILMFFLSATSNKTKMGKATIPVNMLNLAW